MMTVIIGVAFDGTSKIQTKPEHCKKASTDLYPSPFVSSKEPSPWHRKRQGTSKSLLAMEKKAD